ncbi:hypothetical protein EC968_007065 [Mortierella alpina]|nr:hypothetical protein EC968_007065 [Mortierella alpina]
MAVATSKIACDGSMAEAQNKRTLEYIRQFTDFSDLIVRPKGDVITRETEAGVLLTGATGSLVRGGAGKAEERVRGSLRERHCNVAAFDAAPAAIRVTVLGNYDTSDVNFGQTTVYKQLEQEIAVDGQSAEVDPEADTGIIGNVVWPVAFSEMCQTLLSITTSLDKQVAYAISKGYPATPEVTAEISKPGKCNPLTIVISVLWPLAFDQQKILINRIKVQTDWLTPIIART